MWYYNIGRTEEEVKVCIFLHICTSWQKSSVLCLVFNYESDTSQHACILPFGGHRQFILVAAQQQIHSVQWQSKLKWFLSGSMTFVTWHYYPDVVICSSTAREGPKENWGRLKVYSKQMKYIKQQQSSTLLLPKESNLLNVTLAVWNGRNAN